MRLSPAEPLGALVDILSGFAFDSKQFAEDGPIPIVRIRDVGANGNRTFYRGSYDSRYVLNAGDMLIAMDGEFRRARWEGGPALLNQRVCRIKPSNPNLDERYLFHFLPKALQQIEAATPFATVKHLSTKTISQIQIPLPPLAEQRRIADILDKADSLRAIRRAVLEQSGLLAKAIFSNVFGDPLANPQAWPRVSLDECATQVTDGEHLTPQRAAAGIKLLSARNVRDGFIDFDNVDFIGTVEYERIRRRCEPIRGDVLISCSGSIGRVAPVDTDEPFALVRSAALVRPNTEVIRTQFLQYMLRTPAVQLQMARSANASSQANLFQRQIRDLSILRPPLDLQDAFAGQVGAVENVRVKMRESLSQVNALFVALQQRAFRGEL